MRKYKTFHLIIQILFLNIKNGFYTEGSLPKIFTPQNRAFILQICQFAHFFFLLTMNRLTFVV
jgi:hypothetical protein